MQCRAAYSMHMPFASTSTQHALRAHHLLPSLPQVPFAIVINTACFTTADHRGDAKGPGMSVLPGFSLFQSLTFAVLPDDEVDQGLLSWINIQLPGFEGVFTMPRKFFLICEWRSVACILGSALLSRHAVATASCVCPEGA